ncbi:MAG: hypothetical protein RR911_01280 [Oscillospiraceae bacterium]
MGVLDDMIVTARDVAQNIGKRAEEVVDVSKLRFEMRDLEKERSASYEKIGRLYAESLKNKTDNSEKCKSLIYRIDTIDARINELSKLIKEKVGNPTNIEPTAK